MGLVRLFLAAVVAVDHFHLILLRSVDIQVGAVLNYLKLGLDAGHAVIFFYMISGFLISYALEHKYSRDTEQFYISRFTRIFPLYWALYAILILVDFQGTRSHIVETSLIEWLPGFLLLGGDWAMIFLQYPQQYWAEYPSALRPAWTLGAELTFYLLAPLLLRSPKLCLAAFAGSVAVRTYFVQTLGFSEVWTYYFFPSSLMFFLAGHYSRAIYHRLSHRLGWLNFGWLALFVVLTCHNVKTAWPFDGPLFYAEMAAFLLLLPFLFEKTKDSRVLNFLGDLSYPLYLTHVLLLSIIAAIPTVTIALSGSAGAPLFSLLPPDLRLVAYTCLFLGFGILVSAMLHLGVETPLATLCRRCFRRWSRQPAPALALTPPPAAPALTSPAPQ